MRESDAHLPPASTGANPGAVSLEQLLALRTNSTTAQPLPSAEQSVSRSASLLGADSTSTNSDGPLLMVVVERHANVGAIRSKLEKAATQVQLQWHTFEPALIDHVQLHQPYAVVLHFTSDASESAAKFVKELQQRLPHMPIFALGSGGDSQAMLAALRAGVKDFLDLDAQDAELQHILRELLTSKVVIPIPEHADNAPLIALLSARAGLGCSLLSTHLAFYVQQLLAKQLRLNGKSKGLPSQEPLTTLLLDIGAPAGDCALYLDVMSEFGFVDAVQSLRRFDKKLASAGLAPHTSGLRLLSLSRQVNRLGEVTYNDVELLVQRLRQYFEFIIADLGGIGHTNISMRVAKMASKVWVVCDQSLAGVVSTMELLRHFETQKIAREKVELIVCRHDASIELSAQHIAEKLQLPLLLTVPERRVELLQAINQGQLLSAQQRRDPYVQALQKLVDKLIADVPVAGQQRTSVLGRWLHNLRG